MDVKVLFLYTRKGEEVWLCDLAGNTLYKGPWEMACLGENRDPSSGPVFKEFLGGEGDYVLYRIAETMDAQAYIVLLSVTPEGLTETVLWDWSSKPE